MEKYNSNGPINIGSGIDLTISELATKIASSVGFEGVIKWDVSKVDGTPQKVLDVQKISNLGWKPSISLDEGIRSTVEWYIENK
jgi:GDP-L-fucose synthase